MKSPTKNLEDRVACMANEGRDAKWKSGNNVCTLSLADSGASSTMRKTTAHMTDVQTTAIKVQTATQGKTMNAVGQGTLHVNLKLADGKCTEMQIPGVLVIPDLAYELTSIQSITEGGHTVVFSKGVSGIYLSQNKDEFVPFVQKGKMWYLPDYSAEASEVAGAAEGVQKISPTELWHLRLGHMNPKYMSVMKDTVEGMVNLPAHLPMFICHCCKEAKLTRAAKAAGSTSRAKEPLELIHVDTAGPMRTVSMFGNKYFTIFTDDYSRFRWIYFHKAKDELLDIFRKFQLDVQSVLIYSKIGAVRRLRSDNGGEYTSCDFEEYLLNEHIRHEFSNAYEQFQNGKAERSIGVVMTKGRAMHLTSGLPKKLWDLTLRHAVYLINMSPSRANENMKTPFEMLHGRKPDVKSLKPFGSLMFAYRHKTVSTDWKMDQRGVPTAYVGDGRADGSKACMGYNIKTQAIVYTTSFYIDETFFPCRPKSDRRVVSCSFGSYPDGDSEVAQMYSLPSDDVLVQNTEGGLQSLQDLRLQVQESEREQRESELLDSVLRELAAKRGQDEKGVEMSKQVMEELLDGVDGRGLDTDSVWELVGYDVEDDHYLVKIGEVYRFVSSASVHDNIMKGGQVYSSVLGVNFDAYDEENEEMIVIDDQDDRAREISRFDIQQRLQKCLQEFIDGQIPHPVYSHLHDVMTRSLRGANIDVADSPELESRLQQHRVESAMSAAISVKQFALAVMGQQLSEDEPKSVQSALKSPEREKWVEAIREEINKLMARGVFRLIEEKELPAGKTAFPMLMLFKKKRDQHGEVVRYKSRCVLDGSKMKKNVDYYESYAPVVDFVNVRLLVAVAHANQWEIRSYDIVLAFTLARPQNPTYVRFPNLEGVIPGVRRGQLAEVVWNLYGDVSAPHSWFHTLKPVLMQMGFVEVGGHPCVMIHRAEQMGVVKVIMLTIYVDDIIVAANMNDLFQWFEGEIGKHFEYTTPGKILFCLGVEFLKSDDGRYLTLSQRKYAKEVVERFGFNSGKASKTPMDTTVKLSLADCPEVVDATLQKEYRSKVGSLQYLAVWTRPDLAYTVAILSRFLHAPGPKHMAAADCALQYLKDTVDLGVTYASDSKDLNVLFPGLNVLVAYSDADFAGCLDTAKSMTGYVVMMNGGPIAWKAGRQANVALSTSAAETTAIMKVTVVIKHLRQMLSDMGSQQHAPTTVHVDNKTAIYVSEGKQVMSETAKHVTVQCKYVAENVALGVVLLQYVTTAEQRADIFTKSVLGPAFRCHRDFMMRCDLSHTALVAVMSLTFPKNRLLLFSKLVCISEKLSLSRWGLMVMMQMNLRQHMKSMLKDEIDQLVKQRKNLVQRLSAKGI